MSVLILLTVANKKNKSYCYRNGRSDSSVTYTATASLQCRSRATPPAAWYCLRPVLHDRQCDVQGVPGAESALFYTFLFYSVAAQYLEKKQ